MESDLRDDLRDNEEEETPRRNHRERVVPVDRYNPDWKKESPKTSSDAAITSTRKAPTGEDTS